MCQRPKRALSISTCPVGQAEKGVIMCVNALNGLFPFLQTSWIKYPTEEFCVNALNGLFPFLPFR